MEQKQPTSLEAATLIELRQQVRDIERDLADLEKRSGLMSTSLLTRVLTVFGYMFLVQLIVTVGLALVVYLALVVPAVGAGVPAGELNPLTLIRGSNTPMLVATLPPVATPRPTSTRRPSTAVPDIAATVAAPGIFELECWEIGVYADDGDYLDQQIGKRIMAVGQVAGVDADGVAVYVALERNLQVLIPNMNRVDPEISVGVLVEAEGVYQGDFVIQLDDNFDIRVCP